MLAMLTQALRHELLVAALVTRVWDLGLFLFSFYASEINIFMGARYQLAIDSL